MIILSCTVSAFSMLGAAIYARKFRGTITAASLLLVCLLVLYGPASLIYQLYLGQDSVIFRTMTASPYFDESVICLNVSIAIMFGCCVLAIEFCDRLFPTLFRRLIDSENWNARPVKRGPQRLFFLLLGSSIALATFMTCVSAYENHLGTVAGFLRTEGGQAAKDAYRLAFAGSKIYLYRVVLESLAPFILCWGLIEFAARKAYFALISSAWLFLAILLGRADTLSKAPFALTFLQLAFAAMLCRHNRLGWRFFAVGSIASTAVFYPVIALTIPEVSRDGTEVSFFFRRAFATTNETLLEFFAAFPHYLSHTFGANIRPIAFLASQEFRPAYADVAYLWHFQHGSTSNAMFIADAWAAFSFIGVAFASLVVGAMCRSIDLVLLSRGKTAMSIAVLSAVLIGVLRLMMDSGSTALVSGGLLIVPITAIGLAGLTGLFERDACPAKKVAAIT